MQTPDVFKKYLMYLKKFVILNLFMSGVIQLIKIYLIIFGNTSVVILHQKEINNMKETIDHILFDKYKRRIKKENSLVMSWQIIIFVIFVSSWQILSSTRIIDPLLFSSP